METSKININLFTWVGIILSLFGINVVNLIFKHFFGNELDNVHMVLKECIILGLVAVLLFYIIPREKNDLSSIGLHYYNWKKSVIWALLLFAIGMVTLVIIMFCVKYFGWEFGNSTSFDRLSKWVITFITIRAGVAEEIFMRGFLLERFLKMSGNKWVAILLSTIPFGLLHYPQGIVGIGIATFLGGVLAVFYFWKRDLKANIIGHFLIDFVPNVVLN